MSTCMAITALKHRSALRNFVARCELLHTCSNALPHPLPVYMPVNIGTKVALCLKATRLRVEETP